MQMISERGVNVGLFPMIKKRGRTFDEDYVKIRYKNIEFIGMANSKWDLKCYKLMDYLSSYVRYGWEQNMLKAYGNLPKGPEDSRLISSFFLLSNPGMINELEEEFENPKLIPSDLMKRYTAFVRIPISKITKSIPGFTKQLTINAIKDCASFMMKMSYPIYSEKPMKYGKYSYGFDYRYNNFSVSQSFSNIFNYKIIKGKEIENGRSYGDECIFYFNTILGACFWHNICCGAYQLIEEPFYSLSESTQIIYRKRFFMYSGITAKLNQDYIEYVLGISSKNATDRRFIFNRIVEELLDNHLVELVSRDDDSVQLHRGKRKKRKVIDLKSSNAV